MKLKEIKLLRRGDWVNLKGNQKGRFQEIAPGLQEVGYEFPSIIVNVPNEDNVGCEESFWPNQIMGKVI